VPLMGHSGKTDMLSQAVNTVKADAVCGISKTFRDVKQSETWLRLHHKRCKYCQTHSTGNTTYNNAGMEVIDLENTPANGLV